MNWLYIVCGIFTVAGIAIIASGYKTGFRDIGRNLTGLSFIAAAGLAFYFDNWWIIGGGYILSWVFKMIFGSAKKEA